MSSSAQVQTSPDQEAVKREALARIRESDFDVKSRVRARIAELQSGAGGGALQFLLNPSNTGLESSALSTNARADGLSESPSTYLSAMRHYSDVESAIAILNGVAGYVESMRSNRMTEAESFALKEITGHPNEIADGRNRKLALTLYARAQGMEEFIKIMKSIFKGDIPFEQGN